MVRFMSSRGGIHPSIPVSWFLVVAGVAALLSQPTATGDTRAAAVKPAASKSSESRLTITAELTDPLGRHVFKLRGTTPTDSPLGVYQIVARVKRVPCPGGVYTYLATGEDLATGNTSRYAATISLTSFSVRPRTKVCGGKLPAEAGKRAASVRYGSGPGGTLFDLMGTRKADGSFVGSLSLLGLPICGFPYQFSAQFSREGRSRLRFLWGMTVTAADATYQGQEVPLEGCQ